MRAILSVYDKTGIVDFAKGLVLAGVEIISSGGTYHLLEQEGIPATQVAEVTQFPECLDGRVKTLHPSIHGGVLANRNLQEHMDTLKELKIEPIDFVVVNLYPFAEVIADPNHTFAQAIENIDIGGPSMIRGAAKNHEHVVVITDQGDYDDVLTRMKENRLDMDYRKSLARKAFQCTYKYDQLISQYLNRGEERFPQNLSFDLTKLQSLRYGENGHQNAAFYQWNEAEKQGIEKAVLLQGKELSYNNINDAQGAIALTKEFLEPVCVAVKHATPCGVAVGNHVLDAYQKAYESDPVSIFGGIVSFNREVGGDVAEELTKLFLEVIIAPSYTAEALAVFSKKKNLRVLILPTITEPTIPAMEFKSVGGGVIIQEQNTELFEKNEVVTQQSPTDEILNDLEFAMKVVKHVKSNGIVVAKNRQVWGIGGGEVSRIWAAEAALARAGEHVGGAVVASDAFFPFDDVVALCGEYGIAGIIQPGGSINDQKSIDRCNQLGIPMVFTGIRHFRH